MLNPGSTEGCSLLLPLCPQLDKLVSSMDAEGEAQGRISFAKLFLTGMLPGLYGLHSHGIMHGDLKPDNVMFTTSSSAVTILDFGCSMRCHQEGDKVQHSRGGTPLYMDIARLCCSSCPAAPSADM